MQMDITLPRFTILIHTVGPGFARQSEPVMHQVAAGPVHWDWLFQRSVNQRGGAGVWTWATDPLPWLAEQLSGSTASAAASGAPVTTPALRLADHRLRYLDFEGDIGKGRGSVRQLMTGHYELKQQTDRCFEAVLRWSNPQAGGSGGAVAGGAAEVRFSATERDELGAATWWDATVVGH
ncbi:hypothetical protein Mal15_57740 [Stieleria maiorica]|uniref:Uncharacterized protein n=1 Tax=Stieleria maiorica TaxID=2795974 RepID=A0A5B9MPT3_9BACT|nr:hypothetical protein [Stieleria maiorica]QEG01696.1 hypothetical protein Mal15_57740 [Stieleria maiorica]